MVLFGTPFTWFRVTAQLRCLFLPGLGLDPWFCSESTHLSFLFLGNWYVRKSSPARLWAPREQAMSLIHCSVPVPGRSLTHSRPPQIPVEQNEKWMKVKYQRVCGSRDDEKEKANDTWDPSSMLKAKRFMSFNFSEVIVSGCQWCSRSKSQGIVDLGINYFLRKWTRYLSPDLLTSVTIRDIGLPFFFFLKP